MHKFEEFVDHCFEKLPMRFKKARVLSNNVHDIAGNDGFVVLSSNHLCESQKFLNKVDKKSLLSLFTYKE
jgi:hypothetical protein